MKLEFWAILLLLVTACAPAASNTPAEKTEALPSVAAEVSVIAEVSAATEVSVATVAPTEPEPPLSIETPASTTTERSPSTGTPTAPLAAAQTLAAGEFDLPAASAFGDPGFHEPFTLVHDLPADLPATAGQRLVVTLRDVERAAQTCGSEHPLSGCATVDWSDAESRPRVPSGGVFDNSLTVQLASERRERREPRPFFLSEFGVLADTPDAFDPG